MGPSAWPLTWINMLGDFGVNFANVDDLYFSSLELYAHGIISLAGLKEKVVKETQ